MPFQLYRHFSAFLVMGVALSLSGCNGGENGSPAASYVDAISEPPASGTIPAPGPVIDPGPIATSTPLPADPSPSLDVSAYYTGDALFVKYLAKFIDDAKAEGLDVMPSLIKGPKLKIKISSLASRGSSVIGLCSRSSSKREVTFSPTFWNKQNETQRELVFHHELGHCVLGRSHRTTKLSTGKYASLMYPSIMSSTSYTSNYPYYLRELFTYNVKLTGMSVLAANANEGDHEDVCGHDDDET